LGKDKDGLTAESAENAKEKKKRKQAFMLFF
jgi:hypothetical protein